MAEKKEYPLFPLSTVLFPGGTLPLKLFETRYLDMLSWCLREQSSFGVVAIKRGSEVGGTPEFHAIGTIAQITSWDQGSDGLLHVETLARIDFV